jgi:hypothetical protein
MGRGRQKAKATRQARDMKYFSPATDLSALERELGGTRHRGASSTQHVEEPYQADYSAYEEKYSDDDDEDDHRRIG